MVNDFAFLGFGLMASWVVVIILLLIFAFEIWMFVSAVTNKHISDTARVLWAIGMVLIHPIIAIIYYFTDHKKR